MSEELLKRLDTSRAVLLGDLTDETTNSIIREALAEIGRDVNDAIAEIARLKERVEALENTLQRMCWDWDETMNNVDCGPSYDLRQEARALLAQSNKEE